MESSDAPVEDQFNCKQLLLSLCKKRWLRITRNIKEDYEGLVASLATLTGVR